MNGILNIDKPKDKTSFSVVALIKRLSGEKRVGHAGTLDPAATGVLPVCLGQGTRVIEFLMDTTKVYLAEIELGITTDTYDTTGKITQIGDHLSVSQEQLVSALTLYRGLIEQTPPMYSSVKHQGKPLYQLARAGITIERKSRPATIYDLELVDWQPPLFTIQVTCGKGTYIRSLAYDIGQTLGCGATLKSLVRLRYGTFDIKNAVSLPHLEDAFRHAYWQHLIYPVDTVLSHWPAMVVSDATGQAIRNGCPLPPGNSVEKLLNQEYCPPLSTASKTHCRAYDESGCFLGALRFNPERKQWQPEKVFL